MGDRGRLTLVILILASLLLLVTLALVLVTPLLLARL